MAGYLCVVLMCCKVLQYNCLFVFFLLSAISCEVIADHNDTCAADLLSILALCHGTVSAAGAKTPGE